MTEKTSFRMHEDFVLLEPEPISSQGPPLWLWIAGAVLFAIMIVTAIYSEAPPPFTDELVLSE